MDPLADGQSRRLNTRVLWVGSNIIKRQHSIEESISPLKTETTAEYEAMS
jgi:hypothetical protein